MVGADPVIVTHALGSYPVYVETGGLSRLEPLAREHLPGRRTAMIADATVHELYRTGRLGPSPWSGATPTFASAATGGSSSSMDPRRFTGLRQTSSSNRSHSTPAREASA